MSDADSSTGALSENRELLVAVAVGGLVFLLLLGLLGFGGAVGVVGFGIYVVVWLAVGLFVLWLLYRFVVAVERIAHAQQRIAAAQNPPNGTRVAAGNGGDNDTDGSHDA